MVLGVGIAGAIFTTTLVHAASGSIALGGITQEEALFKALQLSFLTGSMITFLGVITSMVRVTNKA
jgi:Na+-transporting NADH:ubiquinone oxidoreductase subunit NqrE